MTEIKNKAAKKTKASVPVEKDEKKAVKKGALMNGSVCRSARSDALRTIPELDGPMLKNAFSDKRVGR